MSHKQRIKHMTSEELKSKLHAHFQKSGFLNHLRVQLRGQLFSELFKVSEPTGLDKFPNSCDIEKCLLPLQVCNWLVYDHLSRQDYQYSLSTFVTEAQLPLPEKFLTAGDILSLLGINQNATDFQNISKLYSENNELGYLHSLLLAILKALFNIPSKDITLNQNHYLSSDLACFDGQADTTQESTRDSARSKSGMAGDSSFGKDFPKFKTSGLNKSTFTNGDCKLTDANFEEQLKILKEENEKTVQKLRHKLLEELENLHENERKMRLEVEQTKAELRKEQDKLAKEKEMLKEREALMEKESTNKFEMKMRDAERDFALKLHLKEKEIEVLERKLSERDEKLSYLEIELGSEKNSCNLMKRELEDLKHMYKVMQDKYSSVLDENTDLLKKFENMSDYSILKEELVTRSKEVTRLQHEIKEIHQKSEAERKKFVETVRTLEDDLSFKESQQIQAREELDRMRNTLSYEQSLWNREKKKLELEFNEFKGLHQIALQRIEDQKEVITELQKTAIRLNYKLTNNAIHAARSESLGFKKIFQMPLPIFLKDKQPEAMFTKRSNVLKQASEENGEATLKFLSDAKSKFSQLKSEEEAVQEKYSYVFSRIPERNKLHQSHFSSYHLTSPPKGINKNDNTHPKSISVGSSLSQNSFASYPRNSYSLTEVKRMVTETLFPHRTGYQTNFQTSFGNAGQLPHENNAFQNSRKVQSSAYMNYSPEKRYEFAESSNVLSESMHGKILDKNTNIQSNDLPNTQNEQFVGKHNQSVLSSETQNASENLDVNHTEKLEKEDQNDVTSRERSFLENASDVLSADNKNVILSPAENFPLEPTVQQTDSNQSNDKVPPAQPILQPSQEVAPDVSPKITENAPEPSSSIFVNLDAAWKRRSSITSMPESKMSDISYLPNTSPAGFISAAAKLDSVKDLSSSYLEKQPAQRVACTELPVESFRNETVQNAAVKGSAESTDITAKNTTESDLTFPEVKQSGGSENKLNSGVETLEQIGHQYTEESAEKMESADSLSELSAIHLSCGSETEQQKEDSDAW